MIEFERHNWEPDFPNEIWIKDKSKGQCFTITLKHGVTDMEIEFDWDYGFAGRGTERMYIPIPILMQIMKEMYDT